MFKSFFHLTIITVFIISMFIGCNRPKESNVIKKETKEINEKPSGNLLFVGMINNRPGLYVYDFNEKKSEVFWSNKAESVINLSYSEDKNKIFFLTATAYGKKGVFPFVDNVKLYVVEDSFKVRFVQKIGSGLQVFSNWTDANTYQVLYNTIDKTIAQYVEQNVLLFSKDVKLLLSEKKTYDLTKDGYPNLPVEKYNLSSPSGKYFLSANEQEEKQIYFQDKERNTKNLICTLKFKLKQVGWTSDENYLFISSLDVSPNNESLYEQNPQTSSLIVYSIKEQKIVKEFFGAGYKNFSVLNNLLIFDDNFEKKSEIIIYDLNKQTEINRISIQGGCGLTKIPEIPNYEA